MYFVKVRKVIPMTDVTIHLNQEVSSTLHERASRAGQSLEDYLRLLAERAAQEPDPSTDPAQRRELFDAWVRSHQPLPHVVDDDRESIYEGRGE